MFTKSLQRCVIMTFLCNNLIDKREKVKPGELFYKNGVDIVNDGSYYVL